MHYYKCTFKCLNYSTAAHLHGSAHSKGQLTEWSFENVNESHGHKDLLSIQNMLVIYQHVHPKHGKGNLKAKRCAKLK